LVRPGAQPADLVSLLNLPIVVSFPAAAHAGKRHLACVSEA